MTIDRLGRQGLVIAGMSSTQKGEVLLIVSPHDGVFQGLETVYLADDHGLTPFRGSGRYASRPVARGGGQGDWSDHDEQ